MTMKKKAGGKRLDAFISCSLSCATILGNWSAAWSPGLLVTIQQLPEQSSNSNGYSLHWADLTPLWSWPTSSTSRMKNGANSYQVVECPSSTTGFIGRSLTLSNLVSCGVRSGGC